MKSNHQMHDENKNDKNATTDENLTPPISKLIEEDQDESDFKTVGGAAFENLEELFNAGEITGTQMAELKAKYTAMYNMLQFKRKSESDLLENAKILTADLELQKEKLKLGKADFHEKSDSETALMRVNLLKRYNQVKLIEEREYDLQYMIEVLQAELNQVKQEYKPFPTKDEIDAKKREITYYCEQTKKERTQRLAELKNLAEDLERKQRQHAHDLKELEVLLDEKHRLTNELFELSDVPKYIYKEIDKTERHKLDIMSKESECMEIYKSVQDEVKAVEEERCHIEKEKNEVEEELVYQKCLLESKEREYNKLIKSLALAKERETVLMGDRIAIEVSQRHSEINKKTAEEILFKAELDRDRDLKHLKKLERQCQTVEDVRFLLRISYKIMNEQDDLRHLNESYTKHYKEMQTQVVEARRNLVHQNTLSSLEHAKVKECVLVQERLIRQQEEYRALCIDLIHYAQIRGDEREQRARECMKAEERFHRSVEEIRARKLVLNDQMKTFGDVQAQLQDFSKLYDIMKKERNRCVNLIQASTQKSAEMKEKIHILSNELDILRKAISKIERDFQRSSVSSNASMVMLVSLRDDQAKLATAENDCKEGLELLKEQLAHLTFVSGRAEKRMIQFRNRYEAAVLTRNKRGIRLIERDEEVCIFYEKINSNMSEMTEAKVSMRVLDDEKRNLQLQVSEETRQLELEEKNVPNIRNLNSKLTTLIIEFSRCQDKVKKLEKEIEDPDRSDRVRWLTGKDLNPTELRISLNRIETRLTAKEERVVECNLIYEQVFRATGRIGKQVQDGKKDWLALAKKVNGMKMRAKSKTRKVMSLVSELAMKQAEMLQLQENTESMRAVLQTSNFRMELGDPPSEEIELEWEKLMIAKAQKNVDQADKTMDEFVEHFQIAGGTKTTAEPRPNAYIPTGTTELPLPRPYGRLAPFKPTEPGSSMRHFRKPVERSIEI